MAKLHLGKSPEQIMLEQEQKKFEKINALEKEKELQNLKLRQLVKSRQRKLRITGGIVAFVISFILIFGIYNTFIKHTLNENDVRTVVSKSVYDFPVAGLDDYINKNFQDWLNDATTYNVQDDNIKEVKYVDSSVRIDKVTKLSSSLARVYFSADLEVTKVAAGDENATSTEKVRYRFFMPIENYYKYNKNGAPTVNGFRPVGQMTMYSLKDINSAKITENDNLKFNEDSKVDEKTLESAKVKVDSVLGDLYLGRDTSQSFYNYLKFNSQKAVYLGIDDFKLYKDSNNLGYNALVKYTVKTKEGFNYQCSHYLLVVKDGKSWIINAFL